MIINLLATSIAALGIAFLGVLKLTGNPRVAEEMSKLGVGRYLRLLGVMEIAFAALFVVRATMKLELRLRRAVNEIVENAEVLCSCLSHSCSGVSCHIGDAADLT
jgi:hypothetical protein